MPRPGNGSSMEVTTTPMTDKEVDALWDPGDAIDEAVRLGVIDAARRHLVAGVPMVIWRDGRIVHVPATEVLGCFALMTALPGLREQTANAFLAPLRRRRRKLR